MTIVLQYKFWDLFVYDDRFEVKLSFNNMPERLVVPFAAIKNFVDPSVPYGLNPNQFAPSAEAGEAVSQMIDADEAAALLPAASTDYEAFSAASSLAVSSRTDADDADDATESAEIEQDEVAEAKTAKVVELDLFRKK
jgi:hypothetical protein